MSLKIQDLKSYLFVWKNNGTHPESPRVEDRVSVKDAIAVPNHHGFQQRNGEREQPPSRLRLLGRRRLILQEAVPTNEAYVQAPDGSGVGTGLHGWFKFVLVWQLGRHRVAPWQQRQTSPPCRSKTTQFLAVL